MNPLLSPDIRSVRCYLETLFGTADEAHLAVWTDDRRTAWYSTQDITAAAEGIAERSAAGLNVYIGTGLYSTPLGRFQRGTTSLVSAIPGAWDDLDIAGPAHARTALPPTQAAAIALLAEFPLRPSLLVDSGHGFYPLWLFHECWHFDGDEDRRAAASLVARLQQAIRTLARRHRYDFETTSDLARVLRPVGALNLKSGLPPALVRIVEDNNIRYSVEDIESILPEELPTPSKHRVWIGISKPSADLDRIMAGCGFMRHCRDDAARLDEPAWHAMVSIVARCRNGDQLVHTLSAPYPRYDATATDRKFDYALHENKPLRCETIRRDRGGGCYCAACPNADKIASPVVLGTAPPPRLRIGHRVRSTGILRPREGVIRVS